MLLRTLLLPELAFLVATAGSAKTLQKRRVSSGAAVQTLVPSGLCDMCSALAVWPVSSPTCIQHQILKQLGKLICPWPWPTGATAARALQKLVPSGVCGMCRKEGRKIYSSLAASKADRME